MTETNEYREKKMPTDYKEKKSRTIPAIVQEAFAYPDDEIKLLFKGVVVALGWHSIIGDTPTNVANKVFKILHTYLYEEATTYSEKEMFLQLEMLLLPLSVNPNPYLRVDTARLRKDTQMFITCYQSVSRL
jgi:hypothetical protein